MGRGRLQDYLAFFWLCDDIDQWCWRPWNVTKVCGQSRLAQTEETLLNRYRGKAGPVFGRGVLWLAISTASLVWTCRHLGRSDRHEADRVHPSAALRSGRQSTIAKLAESQKKGEKKKGRLSSREGLCSWFFHCRSRYS